MQTFKELYYPLHLLKTFKWMADMSFEAVRDLWAYELLVDFF
jgi:hypothetical protein